MGINRVFRDVYRIGMGYVSAYLIAQAEVAVIDTGLPKHREIILRAVSEAGRKPDEVKHILLTHHHADHTGSLAELMGATSGKAYIHPLDAAIVRGEKPAPGPNREILAGRILGPLMARITPKLQPIADLQETNDGDEVPAAGGMKAIHTPGHTAGHLSFLWPQNGGVLFAGDAVSNVFRGPRPPVGALGGMFTEDMVQAKESFRKLAELEFEVACFGHGGPIKGKAHAAFRREVEKLASLGR
ncbi:MAG: MBL fold metallo-hydrolase [Chloroflexi bacterium]|nr:MAG: MBL fold metallo-hydrolase [Chloroflexota bacterium]